MVLSYRCYITRAFREYPGIVIIKVSEYKDLDMNNRKLLLAYIRKDDYAHAGETEAIELSMKEIPKNTHQHLLDVGCGLGGTAHYLEKQGWGKVSGIDRDSEVIRYAKLHYPQVYFKECDVLDIAKIFITLRFDIIYSFNAFFSFPKQADSLKVMSFVAKEEANLVIFDYTSPGSYLGENPFQDHYQYSFSGKYFFPINLETIELQLYQSGWELNNIEDLSEKYHFWYEWLLKQLAERKEELINLFGDDTFHDLYNGYQKLIGLIEQKKVGGAVIRAIRNPY